MMREGSEPMTEFLDGKVVLYEGDCLTILDTLEAESVDAVICDPPYHLHSITKRFAKTGRTESTRSKSGPHQRTAKGFMSKSWDGGTVAFQVETWRKVIRVLKPGGYIVSFSSARTFGRMSVAIEDAGFINHPMIGWIFASGMPKSHDAAKAIDRELGEKGTIVPNGDPVKRKIPGADQNKVGWEKNDGREFQPGTYVPATPEAEEWSGYGYGAQAMKPALEPIYVGQKPFSEHNGAANLLKHGVGAIHIDAGRIAVVDRDAYEANAAGDRGHDQNRTRDMEGFKQTAGRSSDLGRWPANVATDGSPEVLAAFPDTDSGGGPESGTPRSKLNTYGDPGVSLTPARGSNSGSAARFFKSVEIKSLCDLCGLPYDEPCDANTAVSSSLTQGTQTADIAPFDAAALLLPVAEASLHPPSDLVSNVEKSSSGCHQPIDSSAPKNVERWPLEKIVQNVRCAGSLCGLCATDIALGLAAARTRQNPVEVLSQRSMRERTRRILCHSLVLYAEGRESTDTILTTANLKTLLGSVLHAIVASINLENNESLESSDRDRQPFHFSSKAGADSRLGSEHPTVKPLDLMQWLVRLYAPRPGCIVLDPFAGTGSTGEAAWREGMKAILIEADPVYAADIARRMELAENPTKRSAVAASKNKLQGAEGTPLFG
jgi:DNA modification methylase